MHLALASAVAVGLFLSFAACGSSDSTGNAGGGSADSTASGATDPFAAARQTCYTKINALRAAKGGGRAPFVEWTSAESCVDEQATSDEKSDSPHAAWLSNTYPCDGNGQNECEGQGPSGISACLTQMWAEGEQPNCGGCDACADAYNSSCPNCDFFGTSGQVCGHYVNLSAKYFSQVACGFSSLGGWDAMNFK